MSSGNQIYDRTWQALLLLAPAYLIFIAFQYYPAAAAFRLGFFQARNFAQVPTWVGLDNYVRLLHSSRYQSSVFVTLVFTIIVVALLMVIGFWISYLIYKVSYGKTVYMIAAIWPYALPPAIAGALFMFLIHPQVGLLTLNIEELTGLNINWQLNGRQALIAVSIAAVWKGLGYNVIFFIAALNKIPRSFVEVGELDGVHDIWMIWKVFLPLISPTLVFLFVMNTIYAFFGTFAIIDIMTGGGPTGSTNILIYNLYVVTFQFFDLGSGAAQSVILFVFVAILMIIQLWVSDKYAYYGG